MTEYERRPPKPKQSWMRNNGVEDCYANLAAAIIEQACLDYVNTGRNGKGAWHERDH